MSNIDEQIGTWRQGLLARDVLGTAEADELEDHLRQEMEHLSSLGLTHKETFLVATHRLGTVEALGAEYSKVPSSVFSVRRLQWMLIGYVSIGMLNQCINLVADSLSSAAMTTGLTPLWSLFFRAAGTLLLATAVLWGARVAIGTRSGSVQRLVTRSGDFLGQRLVMATVAMIVFHELTGILDSFLIRNQIQQMQANLDFKIGAFLSTMSITSSICSLGLPVGLAILTVWARRRKERGYAAQ